MPYKWTFDGQLSLVDYSKNTVGQLPNCLTGLPRLSNRYQHQSSSNHRLHSALSVALLYNHFGLVLTFLKHYQLSDQPLSSAQVYNNKVLQDYFLLLRILQRGTSIFLYSGY